MAIKAEGRWAWWNQYMPQSMTTDRLIDRAKEAKLDGVIVKGGYWGVMDAFQSAGIRVGVDVYTYPHTPFADADILVHGIRNGAEFAIINAEAEWEQPDSGEQMRQLCERVKDAFLDVEMYASVDTRGGRMSLPYQQALSRYITGWMPMIYPKAFQQSVVHAFSASLDGHLPWADKPILPTIQTYDGIGVATVTSEIAQCYARGLKGYQAYTIGHATDAEWAVIVNDAPREETDMPDWLDTGIVGLDGQPLTFRVLQADLTFAEEYLTYKRWLTLMALGFLESTHSHTVVLR